MTLKSCSYCGRIHPKGYECPMKPKQEHRQNDTEARQFRRTNKWRKKALRIKDRDHYLCQACVNNLGSKLSRELQRGLTLEVHHIEPVIDDPDKALDDDNLITLCQWHHKEAERGVISKEKLKNIAKNNNLE